MPAFTVRNRFTITITGTELDEVEAPDREAAHLLAARRLQLRLEAFSLDFPESATAHIRIDRAEDDGPPSAE